MSSFSAKDANQVNQVIVYNVCGHWANWLWRGRNRQGLIKRRLDLWRSSHNQWTPHELCRGQKVSMYLSMWSDYNAFTNVFSLTSTDVLLDRSLVIDKMGKKSWNLESVSSLFTFLSFVSVCYSVWRVIMELVGFFLILFEFFIFIFLGRPLMIGWRKKSWNPERVPSVVTLSVRPWMTYNKARLLT